MIRVEKTPFRTSKQDLDRLFQCNRESARAWNGCLEAAKHHHQSQGQWINRTELQAVTKRQYALHSQSIQSVQERYLQARDNAWKAKQAGYKPNPLSLPDEALLPDPLEKRRICRA